MVSSGGDKGGERAQKALRQIGEYCQVKFMDGPLIAIKRWEGNFFDDDGNLIDEKTRESLRHYLSALALWIDKYKRQ
jgi:NAD(P)H-dependent FMN reductase